MYKVLTRNKIAKVGLERLDPALFTYADTLEQPDAILVRSADLHGLGLSDAGTLQCIARAGAGVNNIPVDRCSEAGIVVFNTPGANANGVKELVLCALFLSARDIAGGIAWAAGLKGEGDAVPALIEKGKSAFAGPELTGKTLGVVGLGAIGVMVANAARTLGMTVLGFDPYLSVDSAWGLSRGVHRAHGLKQIYAESDYISLHVPLGPETRGMINAEVFAHCKPGLRIINLARGDLVRTDDLLAALSDGRVARYVTDFPTAAMLGHEKIVAIPHLGASTPESEDNCAVMAAKELSDFLLLGHIRNSVNYPNISLEVGEGCARLCVAHRNIPMMVSALSSTLAEAGINIENMVNRSNKDYAYTLLDVNAMPSDDLLRALSTVDGILRTRLIARG
ncbi:MAG: phosphoglycerate dehydrogenase [Oscillospiraceae bacterium]|jgi:D-3-phosphoglycerate dehydrogenase|nr:phosphoglycerate dehydrogenase [Oscillospiraceae bacterium]